MFYLINKKSWMTSFQVIRELRKKLGIKKMWHIGTLDPLASGLILIATEQSTKLLSLLNTDKKWYIFRVELSGKTDSLDLETPIEAIDTTNLTITNPEILAKKLSEITSQVPPRFSAIHINWQRAYKLARKDRDFDIPEREISVSNVEIIEIWKDFVTCKLVISSGGYIRPFAPVIGEMCGINGGYISLLHRNKLFLNNIILTESDAQDLENFDKNNFISEKKLFPNFLHIFIENAEILQNIKNGIPPKIEEIFIKKDQQENFLQFFWNKWQKIFLTFENNYCSLLSFDGENLIIERNDVKSRN